MLQVEPRGWQKQGPHTGPLFAGHSSKGLTTVLQTGWTILILEISQPGRQWKAGKFLDMQHKLQLWWQNRPEGEAYLSGSQESVEAAAWQLEAQNRLLSWIHKAASSSCNTIHLAALACESRNDLRRTSEQALAWPMNGSCSMHNI